MKSGAQVYAVALPVALLLLTAIIGRSAGFIPQKPSTLRLSTKKHAFPLNTALEWLAIERSMEQKYGNFGWFVVSDRPANECDDDDNDDSETLPLYPLGATYLPSMTNHTLNNVEARNIQMAQDLHQGGRFCVTLAATDTGRLASVGTVMRILELEPHEREGQVKRIIIKCRAEELVDIEGIINPEAADREHRLRHPKDYLKAKVRRRVIEPTPLEECEEIISNIIEDYNYVRATYLDGVGASDLPPFALEHLAQALPAWNANDLTTDSGFWEAALVWQTLAYTVREGRQMILSADRNELMVAAASAKGPLKLPIHVSDLSPTDRFRLQELERQAQSDFLKMGLDPCLDFQVMLAMDDFKNRLKSLSKLISRERRRLEELALEPAAERELDEQPRNRTGAWFEGFE
jgi:Lon protease-like protein